MLSPTKRFIHCHAGRLGYTVEISLNQNNSISCSRKEFPILRQLYTGSTIRLDLSNGQPSLPNDCSGPGVWNEKFDCCSWKRNQSSR